ncbi:MAG: hypothetical protein OXD46_05135 [Chloroflexi bacterium]|nr:hypothetical protein [Chloroflexota bacterium]
MTTPTAIRTLRDFAIHESDGDSLLTAPLLFGKVQEYQPIMPDRKFLEAPNGLGVQLTPDSFEKLEPFTFTIQDYSTFPERLYDDEIRAFIAQEAIISGADATLQHTTVRYLGWLKMVDYGTNTRGELATVGVQLQPIEIWRVAPASGTPASFPARSAPTANDYLRYNVNTHTWWSNGVDRMQPLKQQLGVASASTPTT